MLVGLDVAPCVLPRSLIKLILVQHDLELLKVNGDGVLADNDAWVVLDIFNLLEPDVRTNITCFETLRWISVKDFCNQIPAF